jgi:anti-sigma regulatory factor (Ser/Thr protein kinase)
MRVPKGRTKSAINRRAVAAAAQSVVSPHALGEPGAAAPVRSARTPAADGSTAQRGQAGSSDRSTCWTVAGEPAAVAGARRTASGVLRGWGLEAVADETVLMLGELVTNAVQHGNGPIELRLRVDDDAGLLFGEVRDASAVLPTRRRAAPGDEDGRGLALITVLAASYGWTRIDGGKAVWFAQSLSAPAAAGPVGLAQPLGPAFGPWPTIRRMRSRGARADRFRGIRARWWR